MQFSCAGRRDGTQACRVVPENVCPGDAIGLNGGGAAVSESFSVKVRQDAAAGRVVVWGEVSKIPSAGAFYVTASASMDGRVFLRRTKGPLRAGGFVCRRGEGSSVAWCADPVGDICAIRSDKLPWKTGRPVGAGLRICAGGILAVFTT